MPADPTSKTVNDVTHDDVMAIHWIPCHQGQIPCLTPNLVSNFMQQYVNNSTIIDLVQMKIWYIPILFLCCNY